MECIHLNEAVHITPKFLQNLNTGSRRSWICCSCRSNKSPWICLKCGLINCGRYVNGHSKSHYENNAGHMVCLDASLMAFCYKCDDFVINDTKSGGIQLLRDTLEATDLEAESAPKRRKRKNKRLSLSDSNPKRKKDTINENFANGGSVMKYTPGLRNLGNTCFMNAILQSLSNLKHFSCYFKEIPAIELNEKTEENRRKYHTRSYRSDDVSLVEELRKILCALWQGSSVAISPDALFSVVWKVVPRFRGYQQHDAHEFMHYLLDRVHTEFLQTEKFSNGQDTIVTGIFGGILRSEVHCQYCGTTSKKQESYLDLSLDIPFKSTSKCKENKVCNLVDCLRSFVDVEELAESERYMCERCKQRQPSTKKFWLLRLPNVLCLHLKRFRFSQFGRSKLETYVKFPIHTLDMNPYLLKQSQKENRPGNRTNIYDLAAVVVHHGSGASSGHYTAYAWHEGAWYHFNDSSVSQTTESAVGRSKAYILFYTRRHPDVSTIERIKARLS